MLNSIPNEETTTLDSTPVVPFLDSSALVRNPAAIQERARNDGYLYFKGLIRREDISSLRADIVSICQAHGLIERERETILTRDGVQGPSAPRSRFVEKSPEWWAFYADVLRTRSLYALPWSVELMRVMSMVLGEGVFLHSCSIPRVILPGTGSIPKPAHQDVRYVGGANHTWTAWIPLDLCTRSIGGISLLIGSHRFGELPVQQCGNSNEVIVPNGLTWASAELRAGDALIFSVLTVHRGLPNTTRASIRLSADYRFQRRSAPVRVDAVLPHLRFLTWQDIYRNWPHDDPLQYYWRRMNLTYATT